MHLGKMLFCNTAHEYNLHGVRKPQVEEVTEGIEYFPRTDVQPQQKINKVSWLLLKMGTLEIAVENFIGATWTVYHEGASPLAARIALLPIFLSVGGSIYAQIHYIVNSAERAIQNVNDVERGEIVKFKHELQAMAGLLGSVMEGMKFYASIIIFNKEDAVGKTIAIMAAAERFIGFLMCKGHSATDVKFGNTIVGKIWYKAMLSPITPNVKAYAESTMPLVGFIVHTQAVLSIANVLQKQLGVENNSIVSGVSYSVALLSGMMEAFIGQKSFSCSKLLESFTENSTKIEQQKSFWYGNNDAEINKAQQLARFIKHATNVLCFIPLTCLHGAEHLLHVSTLLIMSVLPIQALSTFVYVSRMSIAYKILYTAISSMNEMLQLYISQDAEISKMSEKEKLLLSLIALPFGFALGFAILMACGDVSLKVTNYVYKESSAKVPIADEDNAVELMRYTATDRDSEGGLASFELRNSQVTLLRRLHGVANFSKESFNTFLLEAKNLLNI